MSMTPPVKSSNFKIPDAGSYPARLYSIIHIGSVPSTWQGQERLRDKVRLSFELPTELEVFSEEKGKQPYVLHREFTYSMSDKGNLRPFLEGWLGKKYSDEEAYNVDLEEFIGKEGLLNVVHAEGNNGATYANAQTISPLPKGLTCPPAINKPFILNYGDQWSEEKFSSLPEWLQNLMMTSSEYDMLHRDNKVEKAENDLSDLPF